MFFLHFEEHRCFNVPSFITRVKPCGGSNPRPQYEHLGILCVHSLRYFAFDSPGFYFCFSQNKKIADTHRALDISSHLSTLVSSCCYKTFYLCDFAPKASASDYFLNKGRNSFSENYPVRAFASLLLLLICFLLCFCHFVSLKRRGAPAGNRTRKSARTLFLRQVPYP